MEARQELRGTPSRLAALFALAVALVVALILAGVGGYLLRGPQTTAAGSFFSQVAPQQSDPVCNRFGGPRC
jgi:hypothetical protein